MKKKAIIASILVVAILVSALGIAILLRNNEQPKQTTHPSLKVFYLANVANYSYVNVTQGTTARINVTFTSVTNQPIEIPIENLTLSTYGSTINPKIWADTGNSSLIQHDVCSYNFSFDSLLLQPSASNTTVLSIQFANNAPVGQYYFNVHIGHTILLNSRSEANDYTTSGVEIIVLQSKEPLLPICWWGNADG
ncbi:MAG TPA: hypothetical protein VLV84_01500 [Candidatus Acidoferrales bacterium]|nr:hypothetical protein [Candidatus Acidoferrales bacterium]